MNPDRLDPESLRIFREAYPEGRNYVVCPGVREPYDRPCGRLVVRVTSCEHLMSAFHPNKR
jgi:hypothetical protein